MRYRKQLRVFVYLIFALFLCLVIFEYRHLSNRKGKHDDWTVTNSSFDKNYNGSISKQDKLPKGPVLNVRDFGAKGDGISFDTQAIVASIRACRLQGGCTIYFPSGKFLTKPFNLTSNMTLFISKEATILGSPNFDDYPVLEVLGSYGEPIDLKYCKAIGRYGSLIGGFFLSDVVITGGGVIHGQGDVWWEQIHKEQEANKQRKGKNSAGMKYLQYTRPHVIEFFETRNILVENITLTRSPFWTVHFVYCDTVKVFHVNILNPPTAPNTDGIDIDSTSNVEISKCLIDTGDDTIAIKSGYGSAGRKFGRPSENVTISDCTFRHGRGLAIGSEMSGDVRNVIFTRCVLSESLRGPRVKTMRTRGGVVENITYSYLELNDVHKAISIDMYYKNVATTNSEGTPSYRNIFIHHIIGNNINAAGEFLCLPESPCSTLHLEDISLKPPPNLEIVPFKCLHASGTSSKVNPQPCFSN